MASKQTTTPPKLNVTKRASVTILHEVHKTDDISRVVLFLTPDDTNHVTMQDVVWMTGLRWGLDSR